MRLTAELLRNAPAFVNAIKERELNLKGYKVQIIENLGVTQDQYDTIDLSENSLMKVDNFPLLAKLQTLLLSRNRISKIATGLGKFLPHLHTIIINSNKIKSLKQIDALSSLKKLHTLSLVNNPITQLEDYRLYAIFRLPNLRVLDFNKVKPVERKAAKAKYGSLEEYEKKQAELQKGGESSGAMEVEQPAAAKTFTPGESASSGKMTAEERADILSKIKAATSLSEVARLEKLLAKA